MSDPKWEYHRPTVSGFYFWQRMSNHVLLEPDIVELKFNGTFWYWSSIGHQFFYTDENTTSVKSRWSGPLTMPYVYEEWRSSCPDNESQNPDTWVSALQKAFMQLKMSDDSTYKSDPNEDHIEDRRSTWDRYFLKAFELGRKPQAAAEVADEMLKERDKRWNSTR